MKNKYPDRKNKTSSCRGLHHNENSQIMVLMGIVLVTSVFVLSSLAANLANLDIMIASERATSLLPEFTHIKETFGLALNYNLADNISMKNNEMIFHGNSGNITAAFNKTRNEYHILALQHDILFNADLHNYWVAHPGGMDCIYYVNVTLHLENRDTRYTENVLYSIICRPPSMG